MAADNMQELLDKANGFYAEGQLEKALEAYRAVLEQDQNVAWAYSRIGAIMAQFDDEAAAEEALNRAIQLDPSLPQAHSNLGNLFYGRGEYEKALAKYKDAVALSPDNPVFYENLHAANKKLGRIADAVAALKQAQRLYRENAKTEAKSRLQQARANLKGGRGCLTMVTLAVITTAALVAMVAS